jgi:hypothetical protein
VRQCKADKLWGLENGGNFKAFLGTAEASKDELHVAGSGWLLGKLDCSPMAVRGVVLVFGFCRRCKLGKGSEGEVKERNEEGSAPIRKGYRVS